MRAGMPRKEADMSFTRRAFVKTVGIGGASLFASRREAWAGLFQVSGATRPPRPLLLHNNENPLGPGEAVLESVRQALGQGGPAGRYPFEHVKHLHEAIAEKFGVSPENVTSGCGSTQVLRVAVGLLGLFKKTRPAPFAASVIASRSSLSARSSGIARTGVPMRSA